MSETSNLTELSEKLEQSKRRELQEIKKIEAMRLTELSQSFRESLETELSLIEADMVKRHNNLRKQLSKIRQETYREQKEGLEEIRDEALRLLQAVNRVKVRYWITPIIIGLTLTIGLAIGLWGLGVVITDRSQMLQDLNGQIVEAKKQRDVLGGGYMEIVKTYKNAIEIKRKPNVWQTEQGTWAVQFKE